MNISVHWSLVQGLRVHYFQAGDTGSPVLLLHGGGTDSAWLSWKLTLEPLAARHLVFAPDWPGYGESDRPDIEYTIDYYINFLGNLLEVLDLHQASLVGVSMGGGAALGFALRWPAQVGRLVLVDSYGLQAVAPLHQVGYLLTRLPWLNAMTWALLRQSRTMVRASVRNIFHNPNVVSEELVDEVGVEVRKPYAGRAFQSLQRNEIRWNTLRTVYVDQLSRLTPPTLIVHGADDRLVPLQYARQAHARIKDSQLYAMAGCGHWPQREKPDEFNHVVAEFLKE